MSEGLKEKISKAPEEAGVYLMKNACGEIIYIGKAKSLKKRLVTYLGRDLSSKTVALMSGVTDIEYKVCPSESVALLLEANLIHQHKPKYNVSLRDDKSYPSVKITDEAFPRVYITRKKEAPSAQYLGPYTNVKLLRLALKVMRRIFTFRSCKALPKKACIYFRLKLCPAPCIGKISQGDYAKIIESITLALGGAIEELISKLSAQMFSQAREHNFEAAAKLRDQINALAVFDKAGGHFNIQDELEELKRLLKLKKTPERIEAFDISNIFGKEATGSMVSFYKGFPDKDNYRKFRIKTVQQIDDYAMLREVVRRRYSRLIEEKIPLPDLILIDGGRAHLLAAQAEIERLGLDVPLVSIAKPRKEANGFLRGREKENLYIRDRLKPINLVSDTPALNLIRRIRDEAHRFAISYHRLLHRKKIIGE